MRYLLPGLIFAPILAVFTAFGAPAAAQSNAPACGSYPVGQESYDCTCPPMSEARGSVWGSGPYTADSNICMAALHYGAIGLQGGEVIAYAFAGMDSYESSMANGVQTSTWGAYGTSFMFEPIEEIPVKSNGGSGACAGFPDSADILTCTCSAQATAKGTFWGNDPYTIDSDICIAARHSGIIDATGGTVTAIRVRGLDDYTASLNNGVQSEPSGPFEGSMVFDRN